MAVLVRRPRLPVLSICAVTGPQHQAGEKFMQIFQAYQDEVIEPYKTSDLSDRSRPRGIFWRLDHH